MILNKYRKAKASYEKALTIFSRHKAASKSVREIKQKLKSIEPILAENPDGSESEEDGTHKHHISPDKPKVDMLADPFGKSPQSDEEDEEED